MTTENKDRITDNATILMYKAHAGLCFVWRGIVLCCWFLQSCAISKFGFGSKCELCINRCIVIVRTTSYVLAHRCRRYDASAVSAYLFCRLSPRSDMAYYHNNHARSKPHPNRAAFLKSQTAKQSIKVQDKKRLDKSVWDLFAYSTAVVQPPALDCMQNVHRVQRCFQQSFSPLAWSFNTAKCKAVLRFSVFLSMLACLRRRCANIPVQSPCTWYFDVATTSA